MTQGAEKAPEDPRDTVAEEDQPRRVAEHHDEVVAGLRCALRVPPGEAPEADEQQVAPAAPSGHPLPRLTAQHCGGPEPCDLQQELTRGGRPEGDGAVND